MHETKLAQLKFEDTASSVARVTLDSATLADGRFALTIIMEAVGIGSVIIDELGKIVETNSLAGPLLEELAPNIPANSMIAALAQKFREIPETAENSSKCIFFQRHEKRPIAIFSIRMQARLLSSYLALAVVDLHDVSSPQERVLQSAFDLSHAESAVAIQASQGLSAPQIASRLGSAPATVRVHLKAVFAKTHTNRQSELAAALARASILSCVPTPKLFPPKNLTLENLVYSKVTDPMRRRVRHNER